MQFQALSKRSWLALLGLFLSLGIQAYFIPRASFSMPLFGLSFLAYLQACKAQMNTSQIIRLGIVFRLSLLFVWPFWSDDYFRFFWDGFLLDQGYNPFALSPQQWNIPVPESMQMALSQMNSPAYFSVYPPACQALFYLSFKAFQWHPFLGLLCFKTLVLTAEYISLCFMAKILSNYQLAAKNLSLYALNPLVIMEFAGNLHLEAFAITGLMTLLYFWSAQEKGYAALGWAWSIAFKLLPLLLAPYFLFKKFPKKSLFLGLTLLAMALFFAPLWLQPFAGKHLLESSRLYFQHFEFNPGIYAIERWIGFQMLGYNAIATIGKINAALVFLGCMFLALWWKDRNRGLVFYALWAWTIYLAFASIVHPWYILPLVALCLFTPFRFPVLWSGLIGFSYLYYLEPSSPWHPFAVALEYVALALFLGWEIKHKTHGKNT